MVRNCYIKIYCSQSIVLSILNHYKSNGYPYPEIIINHFLAMILFETGPNDYYEAHCIRFGYEMIIHLKVNINNLLVC